MLRCWYVSYTKIWYQICDIFTSIISFRIIYCFIVFKLQFNKRIKCKHDRIYWQELEGGTIDFVNLYVRVAIHKHPLSLECFFLDGVGPIIHEGCADKLNIMRLQINIREKKIKYVKVKYVTVGTSVSGSTKNLHYCHQPPIP